MFPTLLTDCTPSRCSRDSSSESLPLGRSCCQNKMAGVNSPSSSSFPPGLAACAFGAFLLVVIDKVKVAEDSTSFKQKDQRPTPEVHSTPIAIVFAKSSMGTSSPAVKSFYSPPSIPGASGPL